MNKAFVRKPLVPNSSSNKGFPTLFATIRKVLFDTCSLLRRRGRALNMIINPTKPPLLDCEIGSGKILNAKTEHEFTFSASHNGSAHKFRIPVMIETGYCLPKRTSEICLTSFVGTYATDSQSSEHALCRVRTYVPKSMLGSFKSPSKSSPARSGQA